MAKKVISIALDDLALDYLDKKSREMGVGRGVVVSQMITTIRNQEDTLELLKRTVKLVDNSEMNEDIFSLNSDNYAELPELESLISAEEKKRASKN